MLAVAALTLLAATVAQAVGSSPRWDIDFFLQGCPAVSADNPWDYSRYGTEGHVIGWAGLPEDKPRCAQVIEAHNYMMQGFEEGEMIALLYSDLNCVHEVDRSEKNGCWTVRSDSVIQSGWVGTYSEALDAKRITENEFRALMAAVLNPGR